MGNSGRGEMAFHGLWRQIWSHVVPQLLPDVERAAALLELLVSNLLSRHRFQGAQPTYSSIAASAYAFLF